MQLINANSTIFFISVWQIAFIITAGILVLNSIVLVILACMLARKKHGTHEKHQQGPQRLDSTSTNWTCLPSVNSFSAGPVVGTPGYEKPGAQYETTSVRNKPTHYSCIKCLAYRLESQTCSTELGECHV